MADQWDRAAFGLTPVSPAVVAPASAQPSAAADKWDPAAFGLTPVASAPSATAAAAPPAPSDPKSGYVANLAAGGNAAVASALGLPVDLATGGINLATRGINAATGTTIPQITDPAGGSGTFKRAMGVIGANPDDVKADGIGQEIARGVGGGIVSAAIPAAGVAGLVRGGVMAAPAAARTLAVLGDATPQNALLGAASGGAGEAAASQVPDEYKPVAGLAGGVLGVGAPLAGIAAGRGLVRGARDYIAPAVGRANPLLDVTDATGAPVNMLAGGPLAATPNQVKIAGRRLEATASDPEAVRAALATQGPPALNDQPTTAQLTRDPGLLAAERGVSRTVPQAQAPFLARAAAQNDARVGAVRGVAEGGDPTALPAALQQQTADADAAAAARVVQIQAQTAGDVARTDAYGQRDVSVLQTAAEQARTAMGGDLPPGSEGQVGAALRAPIDAANQEAKARESALWNQIDPDGTLAVNMAPIKDGAREILKDMSPNAAPLAGSEAGIFETAAALPNVQSFKDLGALRSRLTDAIRQERGPAGDPQAVRRMSMLLGHVSDAMEAPVVGHIQQEEAAIAAGTAASENATVQQFLQEARDFVAQRRLEARQASAGGGSSQGSVNNGQGRSAAVSGARGAEGKAAGEPGNVAGNTGLQEGQPALTPNFDAEAQARYAAARQATADRAATFKNPPGIKEALQGGQRSGTFRLPDTSVPAAIIRTGPEGALRVQSYLAASGSPEALSEAAAFSLRREAMRSDGTLDPAKYAAWAKQRSSFLSALPDAAARFGAAADAQRAAETGAANAAQTLKDAVKAAQQTVDDAVSARADQAKAVQQSVVGKFLGTADPVTRVASILRSPTAVADMRTLAERVAGDPEAKAGLQRAVAEHILRDLKGDKSGVAGDEKFLNGAQLQKFLRTREPALREVLTPAQVASLRNVAESLERSDLSVSGSKMAGGSDSLQIASAGSAAASTFLGQFIRKTGTAITTGGGTLLGSLLGGPVGAGLGFVSGLGVAAAQAGREAGLRTVDDLVANAMLHPQLAAVLLAKVTPNNRGSLSRALVSQLRRISLVSSAVGQQDQGRAQKNALLVH